MSDDVFRPFGPPWQDVSPALTTALRIITSVPLVLLGAVVVVVTLVLEPELLLRVVLFVVAGGFLTTGIWTWWWADRSRRARRYAEQEDDLIVTSGVMFRRLVAIPYGRMQFVDVSANPLERFLKIATVSLHTASTETAAHIHGLPAAEATRLRNRLTELGESHGAGI